MPNLIVEGQIINHHEEAYGQVEINIQTGLIERVGENLGRPDLEVKDCLIFPGFVDVHVHARQDVSGKQEYKEDFASASAAAINGGVVAFADMPNNPIPPVDDESYRDKQKLIQKAAVDIVLYAGVGSKTNPLSFPVPYKVYMGPSVGDIFFNSKQELEVAIQRYRGQSISFHCEDPEILVANKNQPTHVQQRPRQAETSAVDFALKLIKKYDLRGKICHISTSEGVEKIRQAKKQGLNVTCEVAPHHLYFDSEAALQMNPPLRQKADCLALLQALQEGVIDFLATDHAPHTKKEAQQGASGLPLLDTYGAFVTWLMREHKFAPKDIVRVCSFNPGGFINPFLSKQFGRGFGQIAEGFMGSLTIINLNEPITIIADKLKTKCGWSPFEGVAFPGRVKYAIIRGKIYAN